MTKAMMCCEPEQEIDTFACGACRKPVLTFWLVKGALLRGQYDLLGDVVFHRECSKAYLSKFERACA